MRVAYDNIIEIARNLSATNIDADSSVNNLWHPHMENAMHCGETDTVITGEFVLPQSVSCIAVAYHNCDIMSLKLTDTNGATLRDGPVAIEPNDSIYYLGQQYEDVRGFELTFASPSLIRIGYVFIGKCVELPRFQREGAYDIAFTGNANQNIGGQVSGVFGRALRVFKLKVPVMTDAQRKVFLEYLYTVQNIKPHMIDLFPEAHRNEPPLYVIFSSNKVQFGKRWEGDFNFSTSIEYTEAR